MSLETEAKLRVDSHEPVRARLRALGATLIESVIEKNVILDRADGSLRSRGCGLRVRSTVGQDGGDVRVTLTFKGPTLEGEFKKREEHEVRLDDAESGLAMLERLGFTTILSYEKRRESWSFESCRIELDDPPHIGKFVEIEGPDENAIRAVQAEIGLGDVPHTRESYVRMLLEYCHKHGLDRVPRFPSG
jgi:adenylate cyclase class 2